jgi:Phospholipase_D-nuclease N-terminal
MTGTRDSWPARAQATYSPLIRRTVTRTLAARQSNTLPEASRIYRLGIERKEPKMMNFGYQGLGGLLILVGDVWAIINIAQSSVSNEKKLIWIIAVVLLPLLGLILWYFLGPRNGKA